MKATGIVNYELDDAFRIFMKNAKKDFLEFNEENPKGCNFKKNINTGASKTVECTIEITEYIKNEKYEITTSTSFTKCVSTYMFKGQKDGTTKLIFEENQPYDKFVSYTTIWLQRLMARRTFKAKFNHTVECLNNELKTYFSNIERSKPKNKEVTE